MKSILFIVCISFSLHANLCLAQSSTRPSRILVGLFDGRTPCRDLASQLNENVSNECTKIKWRLTLYKDSLTNQPTTYELIGFAYRKGNPRKGEWKIERGTKHDPEAVVYQLNQPGGVPLFFQLGDENILFFLDQEKKLMIGNRDFSYTLNRINMKPTGTNGNVESYIADFPADTQRLLEQVRATIKKAAPDAEEKISYGIPTFTLQGNLVHFAGYKNHIGFYPAPSGIVAFKKELGAYKSSKGAVQFPIDKPIPFEVIAKIVKYRVKENLKKATVKKL